MLWYFKILSQININPDDLDLPQGDVTDDTIATALEITFSILGIVAMLIIVIAGLLYTLSRGNPDKAGKARNAIIYAAVGLVIAMLAFTIVRFVVREAV